MSILHSFQPGDHVVAPHDAYHGATRLLRDTFKTRGLGTTYVDMAEPRRVEAAMRLNTKLLWVETPSNPLLKITDIARVAAIAHAAGALCVCDNTFATPALQRPFDLGADLILHSTTKYLDGHGDAMGGAIIAKTQDDMFQRIRNIQVNGGAVPSPFDCWLILRGIRTLPYRLRAHSENALKLASYLSEHASVEAVHYPGLSDHPGHAIAARQMALFGGMLSFQVRGGRERAFEVAARLRVFTRATSLGGAESLIEHRASIEGPGTRTPDNLLRVSVGLEHADDLIADLAQALA